MRPGRESSRGVLEAAAADGLLLRTVLTMIPEQYERRFCCVSDGLKDMYSQIMNDAKRKRRSISENIAPAKYGGRERDDKAHIFDVLRT